VKLLLWVGTSRIAGKGLFTAQAITRGSRIIQYTGEKITKAESNKRLAQGNNLTIPILNFSEHSCVFPADSP
jgi:hypothetical protein